MEIDQAFFDEMEARIPKGGVRTRFAPSPTGYMHVGNLRTALYTWLIARHAGGTFILRIEDTDQNRQVAGATEVIYRTLAECGLTHDEGPDTGGPVGPYIQSERRGLYSQYARLLVEKGAAYYCFCEKAESEEDSGDFNRADDPCRSLDPAEAQARVDAGEPFVIRQKIPHEGVTTFHDVTFGDITVENSTLDDQVLLKRDGLPTYNFANVVDDHLMGITHVVRGNEYLSSSPKYNRLYDAFGWEVPVYVHCPLITNEEYKKLSKRSGHSSYEDLIEQGFISEAVVNYVALLGWSPESNREIFSLEEMVKEFDYRRMSKSPAVFDMTKLKWMNGEYMKAMDFEKFYERAEGYIRQVIKKDLDLRKIAAMVKTRIEIFPDIAEHIDFFEELPEYDVSMYTHKKMKTDSAKSLAVLKETLPILEAQEDFTNDALYGALSQYVAEKGYKTGFVMWPLRTAVSGKQMTPAGATEIMDVLGKEESLKRIRKGISMLEESLAQA